MNVYEGKLIPGKIKVGIVAARFNEFITSRLLSGALDGLRRHEVGDEDIDIAWVPGAFEIPLAASKMASSSRYDAVICLGAVIRGSTSHCMQRGFQGNRPCFPYKRDSGDVRRADHGNYRTGH